MSRYIDFYLIGELVDSHGNVHYEDLKNLPTADVVPREIADEAYAHGYTEAESKYRAILERKKGEWIKFDEGDCHCSECQFVLEDWTQGIFYNYCPNCGADMRGTKK